VPPERVAAMAPRLQTLLGYEIMPPFMGHVTASHPTKVLRPGYVNALAALPEAGRDRDEAGHAADTSGSRDKKEIA